MRDLTTRHLICTVLTDHARLKADAGSLDDHADLYQLGLTSHASVNVMLALEDSFDVEFPNQLLRKSTFQSIGSISAALEQLGVKQLSA
jgi:acyl carrier protein